MAAVLATALPAKGPIFAARPVLNAPSPARRIRLLCRWFVQPETGRLACRWEPEPESRSPASHLRLVHSRA